MVGNKNARKIVPRCNIFGITETLLEASPPHALHSKQHNYKVSIRPLSANVQPHEYQK